MDLIFISSEEEDFFWDYISKTVDIGLGAEND